MCRTGGVNVQTAPGAGFSPVCLHAVMPGTSPGMTMSVHMLGMTSSPQLTRFQVWPPQNMPPKAQPCTRIAFGPFIAIVES